MRRMPASSLRVKSGLVRGSAIWIDAGVQTMDSRTAIALFLIAPMDGVACVFICIKLQKVSPFLSLHQLSLQRVAMKTL